MKSPYRTDEETIIAMSGGRTSAYMLWCVLNEYDMSLPDHIKVIFNNTGKELPQTLDFVRDIQKEWGVEITWIERHMFRNPEGSKFKYGADLKVVDHATASRNGEPMEAAIKTFGILPNPVNRYCSAHLKPKGVRDYVDQHLDWEPPFQTFVGIRADEDRRARKLHNTRDDRTDRVCPLWLDGVTKYDVAKFWDMCSFDLQLPNVNGQTDWGNCDLCFLKAARKKQSIIQARPELADWWIGMEKSVSHITGNGRMFRIDHPSIETMKMIATDQGGFDFDTDEQTIPCFCGD